MPAPPYASPLHRTIAYWRIRCDVLRGVASVDAIAAETGYSRRMVNHIVQHATPPDYGGLDEATALQVSAAGMTVHVAAHLIATHRTATVEAQADHLGVSVRYVCRCRSQLYALRLLAPQQSVHARSQRQSRDGALVGRVRDLTTQGWSRDAIAAALKTSPGRIGRIIADLGGAAALRATVSLREAAALLGVHEELVRSWVDQGWLWARRNPGTGRNTVFRVPRPALRSFVRVRAAWPSYSIATIADDELRDLAQQARATAGGRWCSVQEVALAVGIHPDTVRRWRRHGWLADWERTTVGKGVFYWWPDGAALPPPPTGGSR